MHLHDAQLLGGVRGSEGGPRDGLGEVWCGGLNRLWRCTPKHQHVPPGPARRWVFGTRARGLRWQSSWRRNLPSLSWPDGFRSGNRATVTESGAQQGLTDPYISFSESPECQGFKSLRPRRPRTSGLCSQRQVTSTTKLNRAFQQCHWNHQIESSVSTIRRVDKTQRLSAFHDRGQSYEVLRSHP